MQLNLRKSTFIEEVDYNFIKSALADYKHPRVKINELLKKKHIIRVKKGLYVFGPEVAEKPFSKQTLANLIYGPSYISLDYALAFYGLIPERVEVVTSITNKRKKMFKTPLGDFSYLYIHPAIYAEGITLYEMDNYHSILIATKEKALADKLYFNPMIKDQFQMVKYLTENLRMEMETLALLNLNRVKKLAVLYGHNVNVFYNVLRGVR